MALKVTAIPAKKPVVSAASKTQVATRRVAAYARVSTASEEQATSYEAQVSYYTDYIASRADWQMVDIYTDEGITGTSTKNRIGFQRMVKDALDGKIDLIVTKSVSRFARNTVDSLTTVRQLKEAGVEIYFEKENIWTLDAKGELLITIMSSLAQEESRSISENVRWGRRKSFADGKVTLPYGHFLGYEKGPDGRPAIDPDQAALVRRIYRMFLTGYSFSNIANTFTQEGIPVPGYKGDKWHPGTIKSILTNEKYRGDALLQKSYIEDFLTKRQVKNKGEVAQYYVTGSHEAIIDPETFELVQAEIAARKGRRDIYPFTQKLLCTVCGAFYGSKVWHSNDKYRQVVWQCNNKYRVQHPANMPHPSSTMVERRFVEALAELLKRRPRILKAVKAALREVMDTRELEARKTKLLVEIEGLNALMLKEVEQNSRSRQNQDAYLVRFAELEAEQKKAVEAFELVEAEISDRQSRAVRMRHFVDSLAEVNGPVLEFDFRLWHVLVDHARVSPDGAIEFIWKWGETPTD